MSTQRGMTAVRLALAARNLREQGAEYDLVHSDPIAIMGMACRFPGGAASPELLWQLICARGDAVTEIPADRFDVELFRPADSSRAGLMTTRRGAFLGDIDRFDAAFFGISPREAKMMDPQQRMLLEVAWEALEDAGRVPSSMAGSRTGVFLALYNHDFLRYQYEDPLRVAAHTSSGTSPAIAAGRLSFLMDLRGPAIVVDTACSSSLVALHLACASIRRGECDQAIVGGSGLVLGPETYVSLSKWGMLAPDGRCKTFDADADGFGRGEGCGVIVLKRLSDALANRDRVRAVVRGSATNQDGRSTDLTAPNGLAQRQVILDALRNARVDPADIGFVETHGTGTKLGDPIEVEALAEVLGPPVPGSTRCALSSVKANIAHLEAAAGVAGVIKSVLVLEHAAIPPQALFRELNPHLSLEGTRLYVPTALQTWDSPNGPRLAGVSSFGFSGTNAHVVLEEAPRLPPSAPQEHGGIQLLVISARDATSLRTLAARHASVLQSLDPEAVREHCFTAAARRTHHEHRLAVVGDSPAAIATRLHAFCVGSAPTSVASGVHTEHSCAGAVFVFSGQGPQWWAMGRDLLERERCFRDAVERCSAVIEPHAGFSVIDELLASEADSRLSQTAIAQPCLFALQVGLANLWKSWGILPAVVVGHSVGEIAAAHVSGAYTLEQACRLVAIRGSLMQRATGLGRMASVEWDESDLEAIVAATRGRVGIAAVNAPCSCVVSGESSAVDQVLREVTAQGGRSTMLPVDYAFHSPQMDPFRDALVEQMQGVQPARHIIPMVSTVTGAMLEPFEAGAAYWGRNVRQPVRFAAAIGELLSRGHRTFLEISPHPVLGASIVRCAEGVYDVCVLASLRRGQPERTTLYAALAGLYAAGLDADWNALFPGGGRVVSLPTYPWKDERFPVPRYKDVAARRSSAAFGPAHPLLGRTTVTALGQRVCEASLSAVWPAFLGDHRFDGRATLPASAYLEAGLSIAASLWGSGVPCELADITLDRAMPLDDAKLLDTQVIVDPEGDGCARFAVYSRRPDTSEWTTHAGGTVRRASEEALLAWVGGGDDGATLRLDGDAFYEAIAGIAPEFGPAFRGVRRLARLADGTLAYEVVAPEGLASSGGDYRFHPAILDACLQGIALGLLPASAQQGGRAAFVPVAVRRMRVVATIPDTLTVRARLSHPDGPTPVADLLIDDAQGRRVAQIEGLSLRRVERALMSRTAPTDPTRWLHELRWRAAPQESVGTATAQGSWVVVDDRQGGARALVEALQDAGVIVFCDEPGATAWPDHCAGVVYVAPCVPPIGADAGPGSVQAQVIDACDRLAGVARRCIHQQAPPRLVVLTRGGQSTGSAQSSIALDHAALWGLRNTLALEHPELRTAAIDLDPRPASGEWRTVVDELLRPDGEDRIAYRDGVRLAARLAVAARPTQGPVRLDVGRRGALDSLVLVPNARRAPGPGEVEIQVRATGLNFRDVLNALGTYPGDPGPLGDECAGVVAAVGPGVEHVAVGDPVMAFLPGAFASYVTGPAKMTVRRPRGVSFAQAASIPIVFLTALYALERIAGLKAGQRALIHAGAGGVGTAAIQLALARGAQVFATAGTPEKRDYLRQLGVTLTLDSRSLAFSEQVLAATDGQGVDVVLNSLSGDFIPAGLAVVRRGGHFVEIGKTGIWSHEQVAGLGRDIRYTVLFLGDERRDHPERLAAALAELSERFDRGALVVPPLRVFDLRDASAAFRFMAQARHIGKVVLRAEATEVETPIRAQATYLVTGGAGGLGLAVGSALVDAGARTLVLTGRSEPSDEALRGFADMRSRGARVHWVQADVAASQGMACIEAELDTLAPLAGIVHAAGTLDDVAFDSLVRDRWDAVMSPKVAGGWNVHRLADRRRVEWCVAFSAGATLLGSPGQANYAAANAFLDALVAQRRAVGLPGASIQWGAWSQVGMAARLDERSRRRWAERGMDAIEPGAGARLALRLLEWPGGTVAVLPARWDAYRSAIPESTRRLLTEVVKPPGADAPTARGAATASTRTLGDALRDVPAQAREETLLDRLRQLAQGVLGVTGVDQLPADRPLREIGLDSLMAVELRNAVSAAVGRSLPATLLFDYPTLRGLAGYVGGVLFGAQATDPGGASDREKAGPTAATVSDVRAMTDAQAEELLILELGGQTTRGTDG